MSDIKSAILWGAIGLVAGGGIYGTYVKTMGKAAFTETQAYALYGKCMIQRTKVELPSTHNEARALVEEIKKNIPDIQKSDSIIALTSVAAGEKNISTSGFSTLLKDCASNLEREIASQ